MPNRMKFVIHSIISPEQGAGQSISDHILIVQEILYNLQKALARRVYMTIKLDIEHKYDQAKLKFLLFSLQLIGFYDAVHITFIPMIMI